MGKEGKDVKVMGCLAIHLMRKNNNTIGEIRISDVIEELCPEIEDEYSDDF